MKYFWFLFLFLSTECFCDDVTVTINPSYPKVKSEIAKKMVTNVKDYFVKGKGKTQACRPLEGYVLDNELITLFKQDSIKSIRVSLFENDGMYSDVSFVGSDTIVYMVVKVVNDECNGFYFYKSKIWTDPL